MLLSPYNPGGWCSLCRHLWRSCHRLEKLSSMHQYIGRFCSISRHLWRHHSLGRFCGGVCSPNTPKSDPHHGKHFRQRNQFKNRWARVSWSGDTSCAYRHQRWILHAGCQSVILKIWVQQTGSDRTLDELTRCDETLDEQLCCDMTLDDQL